MESLEIGGEGGCDDNRVAGPRDLGRVPFSPSNDARIVGDF